MSQKLKSVPSGECGYFLLGNVMKTGESMVVAANKSVFNVTPPDSGNLYVTISGTATDLRVGDDVRISLSQGVPQVATVINVYRTDEGEAASSGKPPGKKGAGKEAAGAARPKAEPKRPAKTAKPADPEAAPKEQTVKRPASPGESHFRRGVNLLANGKRDAAIEAFNKAREADPSEEMAERVANALKPKSPEPSEAPEKN
jgi:hypothetical protein